MLADAVVKEQEAEPAVVIVPLQTHGQSPAGVSDADYERRAGASRASCWPAWTASDPSLRWVWPASMLLGANERRCRKSHEHCVAAIRQSKIDGPLHLVGHSFGGILAYEVARQLHEAGIEVGRVAIIDAWLEKVPGSPVWRTLRNVPFFFVNLPHWILQFTFKKSLATKISAIRGRLHHWKAA